MTVAPSQMSQDRREHVADKMQAIARLSGGIAHQFNNLLTAILSTADLALSAQGLPESVRGDLMDIREAGQRAAGITRQLLAFSGGQSVSLRPIVVGDLLLRLEPLVRHLLPANVTLVLRAPSKTQLSTDPVRLEQVLLNLVVNAVDALTPRGGTIRITADDSPTHPVTEIVVSDDGPGMDEETRRHVFEPFFTTKQQSGEGVGLGLASVYGTMSQLGGSVTVESAPGEGTSVRLVLPRESGVAVNDAVRPVDDGLIPSEVILVVEDEPMVRAPICRTLRGQGYFVLEAKNGEDALLVMQAYHSPIHLVISDVMMPEMDGAQLISLLRDWYPALRVLFISGYSPQYLESQGGAVSGSTFLAKPFTMETLTTRVRTILDSGWTVT